MIKRVDSGGQVHLVTNIRKPRKWRRYEYLLSSGAQWINTGVNGYMNHRYELDYLQTGTGSYRMWGVFGLSTWLGYNMSITYSAGRSVRWSSTSNGQTLVDNIDTITNTTRHTFIIDKGQIYYDGVNKGKSAGHSDSCVINYPIYLFTVNPANTTPTANAVARVYSYKDYNEAGTLIRHLVPAQYNGEYGMWDLVEDRFYPNKGTGTFTVGPEIKNYDEIYEVRKTTSLLPSGVELYDYILSSGTLYIDTGYIPKGNFGTEVKFQLTRVNDFQTIWGSMPSSSQVTPRTGFHNYAQSLWMAGINKTSSFGTANTNVHTLKLTFSNGNETMILDGSQAYTGSPGSTALSSNTLSIYLFARNLDPISNYTAMKCYYFSINDGSKLVRNFLPCTYLGEPGMWDTVENKFYRNQGTGLFTLGNKITLKEYESLTSDGYAYINTLYIPNNNTKIDLKFDHHRVNAQQLTYSTGYRFGRWDTTNGFNYIRYYDGNQNYDHLKVGIAWPSGAQTTISLLNGINQSTLDFKNKVCTLNGSPYTTLVDFSLVNMNLATGYLPIFALVRQENGQVLITTPKSAHEDWTNTNCTIYYYKIFNNGILVRDFIPVSYNGTPGLWDKVEWKFYANAGSGSFTLGPEKKSGSIYLHNHLTNLFNGFVGGGRMTLSGGILNGTGASGDTYFYTKTTQAVNTTSYYLVGIYVEGYTSATAWPFLSNQSNSNACIKIIRDGWNWGYVKFSDSNSQPIWDDTTRPSPVPKITISDCRIYKIT